MCGAAILYILVFGTLAASGKAGTLIDQIAVIVGKHVIKTSDIDLELRITAFLNSESVKAKAADKRCAAERLIDQEIIRTEIVNGGFRRPAESQAVALESELRRDRFGTSETRMRETLNRYGLSGEDLREKLLWQLTVLNFIEQRFRANSAVSDEEVRFYYDQHAADLRRQYPQNFNYQALAEKVRNSLEGERVNQNFNQWLTQARDRYRIEYKQEALK